MAGCVDIDVYVLHKSCNILFVILLFLVFDKLFRNLTRVWSFHWRLLFQQLLLLLIGLILQANIIDILGCLFSWHRLSLSWVTQCKANELSWDVASYAFHQLL